jgi:hypothetical protein
MMFSKEIINGFLKDHKIENIKIDDIILSLNNKGLDGLNDFSNYIK